MESQTISQNIFEDMQDDNLKIILYSSQRELEKRSGGMENISGFYDVATTSMHLLNYSKEIPQWQYEHSVLHEYGHYKLYLFTKKHNVKLQDLPQWFNEGIAEYIGYNGSILEYSPLSLKKVQAFKEMDTNKGFQESRKQDYNPYLQSCYAIDSLIEMNSSNVIKNIFLEMNKKDFYKAFKSVTGLDIDEFEKQFLRRRIEEYNKKLKK